MRKDLRPVASLVATLLLLVESSALRAAKRSKWENHYNYTPPMLHPKACRSLSKEECEKATFPLLTKMQQKQRERNLQGGTLEPVDHNPRTGNIKVLVLLVQFTDHNGRNLTKKNVIEELWNGQIKDWFAVNSQGKYAVEPVVQDWVVTDNTEAFYAQGISGFTQDLQKAMYPALRRVDSTPGWDWSQYDSDQNGRIDSVVMLHSGISAVAGPQDCFGRNAADLIWPHAFTSSLGTEGWTSADGTVTLGGYTVNSVFDALCDDIALTSGLTTHEYMHTMNTIDLYDGSDLTLAKGVGMWDIMGHPYGADNSGTPGLLGAWMKKVVGWVTPILITADGDYISKPAHDNAEAYMINLTQPDATAEEYLLIENRSPIGFEANIGGSGLLIWHIDDAAEIMKRKGFPGQPGWPQNGNHYMVAILPKDGRYDMENNANFGDVEDLFTVGDKLTPGMGGTVYPNTDSYQGGRIVETGITLEVIEQSADTFQITFRISGLGGQAAPLTPAPTEAPVQTPATGVPTAATTASPGVTPTAVEITSGRVPTAVTAPPSPPPAPGTATTFPLQQGGGPTDQWILSRPPGPTRAPFVLPDIPYLNPEDFNGTVLKTDSAGIVPSKWHGAIIFGVILTLFGLLV